jgi:hypothetical protein
MKNKLLILNIISYIILYHIVYELINYFFVEKGHIGITPIGYIIERYNYLENEMPQFSITIVAFLIHMFVSGILLYCIYKWYNKMSFSKLFFLLLFVFIITSVLLFSFSFLFLIIFLPSAFMIVGIFIYFYLFMPIMAILILPLFKLNKMLLGDKD